MARLIASCVLRVTRLGLCGKIAAFGFSKCAATDTSVGTSDCVLSLALEPVSCGGGQALRHWVRQNS